MEEELLSAACQDFLHCVVAEKTHRSVGGAASVQHHAALVLSRVFKHHIFRAFTAFSNLFPARKDRLLHKLAVQDIIGLSRELKRRRQHECATLIQDISQFSGREGRRKRDGNGIGT